RGKRSLICPPERQFAIRFTPSRGPAGVSSLPQQSAPVPTIRALGTRDAGMIGERHDRYRQTDRGRPGDEALGAVANDPRAALALLREQIRAWNTPGAMPPFRAAAWALGAIFAARPARTITSVGQR